MQGCELGLGDSSPFMGSSEWYKIKFDQQLFDDLFLALHSPGRIDIILHDGVTGITRSGVRTTSHGHDVRVQASRGVEDASQACQEILDKMLRAPGSCQHIGTMRTDSAFMVSALKKEQATESFSLFSRWYGGVPLSNLGPCSRGHRLEEIAFFHRSEVASGQHFQTCCGVLSSCRHTTKRPWTKPSLC